MDLMTRILNGSLTRAVAVISGRSLDGLRGQRPTVKRNQMEEVKNGDTIAGNNTRDLDEELDNFVGDYYPEVEVDDNYESSETKDYY
ncbi:hypothetical protein X777_14041 [Ooceraea biroi]|uniref:Uncharacterized protein n=1 Tax=Ooceraea biroi TaxID=2015173 RepID=A0A026VXJ2_OOCBI|nr:hypothetical protein X777_14041 [Ooceraea biroi]